MAQQLAPLSGNPHIDVVILGGDAESLRACFDSVRAADYPQDRIHLFYAGELPGDFPEVRAIPKGRLTGDGELVQFLHGTSELDRGWFRAGVSAFRPETAAVCGRREESQTMVSPYSQILQLEANPAAGKLFLLPDEALVRRSALAAVGGYAEQLGPAASEDFGFRVHARGLEMRQLNAAMLWRQTGEMSVGDYWSYCYKQGKILAVVAARHRPARRSWWRMLLAGLSVSLLVVLGLLLAMALSVWFLILLFPAIIVLLWPRIFGVQKIAKEHAIGEHSAASLAWHRSIGVIPKMLGALSQLFVHQERS